ncbi:hypothetical protein SAMN06269185_1069 [Natronoarchaeum philippinense]|uniref:Uncharacterized protein n=1 Tax=Natronoarchaeum philippinense TaxID=558529 RepID=A0A285NA17_NATPI|nr:hypothetical protein [Natronoarchaeum philippinense]SNZ06158.1 hypothetical protein SAMN06269185_1069 [Natronoarchaeum philippinense]
MASFDTWLRAGGLLGFGSLVYAIFYAAATPLVGVHKDLAPADSQLPHWADLSVTWFPAVILASLLVMVIAAATLRRGGP